MHNKKNHSNTRKLLIKQEKPSVPEKADVMYAVLSEIRCITYVIALPCRIYIWTNVNHYKVHITNLTWYAALNSFPPVYRHDPLEVGLKPETILNPPIHSSAFYSDIWVLHGCSGQNMSKRTSLCTV